MAKQQEQRQAELERTWSEQVSGGIGNDTMGYEHVGTLDTSPVVLTCSVSGPAKKLNRHVVIALKHMNARRTALLEKRALLNREIEELDAAILALE